MRRIACEQPCGALARIALEALLDLFFGKLVDLLDANGHLGSGGAFRAHGLLDQKRIRAVAQHHDVGGDFVFAGEDADHLAGFVFHQLFDRDAVDVLGAGVFSLLGQPLVERAAKNGVRLLAVLQKVVGGEIDGEVRIGRHQRDALVGHFALEGNLVEVVGEHGAQAMSVDAAARHVLRTREVAALDHEDRFARLGELVGGDGASAAGADDDRVEVCH